MEKQDRRLFLKKCVFLGAAATAGSAVAMTDVFGKDKKDDEVLSLGKLAEFSDGKKTMVEKAIRISNGKVIKTSKLIVARKGDQVYVMSTRCTHFGCEVDLQADQSYVCPCHKSKFDKNGLVTKGPAKRPLDWYEVKITDVGDVEVNLGKIVGVPKVE